MAKKKLKECKCHYQMFDMGWYWMCSKCFKTEPKDDFKSRLKWKLIKFISKL